MQQNAMRTYRIMIVDDQRDARRVLRAGLETLQANVQIVDVPSGEEAILVNSRQPFDLLIVDVRLPGISGLELIEHAHIRNPGLKVILITGVMDPEIRKQVAVARADAYFFKPIAMPPFLEAVRRCLNLGLEQVGAEPPTPRPSAARISERLADLRVELQAHCALLISERGEYVAQAGAIPKEIDEQALAVAVLGLMGAVEKAGLVSGVPSPKDLTLVSGANYDLAFTHVSQSIGLLLIAEAGAYHARTSLPVAVKLESAAMDLLGRLSGIGVAVEPVQRDLPFPAYKAGEAEPDFSPKDLDKIFKKAKEVKGTDADAFWDMAIDQEQFDETLRSDALSYEQARRLGLAPDDR